MYTYVKCVFIYEYIYVCIHINIYMYSYTCIQIYFYICVYMRIYTCMHLYGEASSTSMLDGYLCEHVFLYFDKHTRILCI